MARTKNQGKKSTCGKTSPPAELDSDSTGQNSDCENSSAENTARLKSTVTQLLSLKEFLSKATTTVDVLVSMLNSVTTGGHDLSPSTRSVSTMTVPDVGTTLNRVQYHDCQASVSESQRSSYDPDSSRNSVKKSPKPSPVVPRQLFRNGTVIGKRPTFN